MIISKKFHRTHSISPSADLFHSCKYTVKGLTSVSHTYVIISLFYLCYISRPAPFCMGEYQAIFIRCIYSCCISLTPKWQCTVDQNRKKHRMNSHPIIHCPTSEGVSEVSGTSEQANGRASGPVLQSVILLVLVHSPGAGFWGGERADECSGCQEAQ